MSVSLLAWCLVLLCPQIKLIEGELMQLTKLEIKRRNLDAENLQVGVNIPFLCLPTFTRFFFFLLLITIYIILVISMSLLHGTTNVHADVEEINEK